MQRSTGWYPAPAAALCYALVTACALLRAAPAVAQFAAQPGGLRVTEASLKADHARPAGQCPVTVRFSGHVTADGPGTVKYTFRRSDGATAPINTLEFKEAGTQYVTTTWTLGGVGLTTYEGWQALNILSPNNLESSPAKFVLNCQPPVEDRPGGRQLPAAASPADFTETYLRVLPALSASHKQRFEAEMERLKTISGKFQATFEAAEKKGGFDAGALRAELSAVAKEPDESRRARLYADFSAKHESRLSQIARAAGVDLAAERQQFISSLPPAEARRIKSGDEFEKLTLELEDERKDPPPPPPPPPDVTERLFRAPFTASGRLGVETEEEAAHLESRGIYVENRADARRGELEVGGSSGVAASHQRIVFLSQQLDVGSGAGRVRVFAALDPGRFDLHVSATPGYASAEAIVNLRVMEGADVVCSQRLSLDRAIVAVFGWRDTGGSRPIRLNCEFTRPTPDDATTYDMVVELEAWTGAGGFAVAHASMRATLQQFQVYLHRR